jgi:hypothetical protein
MNGENEIQIIRGKARVRPKRGKTPQSAAAARLDKRRDAIYWLATCTVDEAQQLAEFINGPDSDAAEDEDVPAALATLRHVADYLERRATE